MATQPFTYAPPTQPYTGSIAQLMLAPGQIQAQAAEAIAAARARAAEQSGQVWGQTLQNVGQDVAQPLAKIASPQYQMGEIGLAQAKRQWGGVQAYAALAKAHPGDWNAIAEGLTQAGYPDEAAQVLGNAASLHEAQVKAQGEQVGLFNQKQQALSALLGRVSDGIKGGADPMSAISLGVSQAMDPNGLGLSQSDALAAFTPAMSLIHQWQTTGQTPKDANDQIVTALKSGMTPEGRTAEATASQKEIDAAMSRMQLDFMQGLTKNGPSAIFGEIDKAMPPTDPRYATLNTQTKAGVQQALQMGPKGWDSAQTILQQALRQANEIAGAAPKAAAVPGSEAQWVQQAIDAATQANGGRPLTYAQSQGVQAYAMQHYKEANQDPAVREALLAQKNLAVQLQQMNIKAQQLQPDELKYDVDQIKRDFSLYPILTKGMPAPALQQLRQALGTSGVNIKNLDSSSRTMMLTAQEILPHIATVEQEAQQLQQAGLMGAVGGHWRDLLAGKSGVAAAVAGNDPKLQALVGKFATDVGLLETAAARAHGGARGGGSPMMLQHFEGIMDAGAKPLNTFLGNMAGLKDWMQGYATMGQSTAPGQPPPATTPNLSGLAAGHGRTFSSGPFKGQTWTIGPDGKPVRVGQ